MALPSGRVSPSSGGEGCWRVHAGLWSVLCVHTPQVRNHGQLHMSDPACRDERAQRLTKGTAAEAGRRSPLVDGGWRTPRVTPAGSKYFSSRTPSSIAGCRCRSQGARGPGGRRIAARSSTAAGRVCLACRSRERAQTSPSASRGRCSTSRASASHSRLPTVVHRPAEPGRRRHGDRASADRQLVRRAETNRATKVIQAAHRRDEPAPHKKTLTSCAGPAPRRRPGIPDERPSAGERGAVTRALDDVRGPTSL